MHVEEQNDFDSCERIDKIPDEIKTKVSNFYQNSGDVLPCQASVSIKTQKQKILLSKTTAELHKDFCDQGNKVSLSVFRKLRPKECVSVTYSRFNQCLCMKCINLELTLKVLKYPLSGLQMFSNKYDLVDKILCDKEGPYHKKACIDGSCNVCGNTLESIMEDYLERSDASDQITYSQWQTRKILDKYGNLKSRKVYADVTVTKQELVQAFLVNAKEMPMHLFMSAWQRQQVKEARSNCQRSLVTIVDFAENYTCVHQDQIQSAYFAAVQVTIMPLIGSYPCPVCAKELVHDSIAFISDDLVHDASAVQTFNSIYKDMLQEEGISTERHIQFSDGCAGQYKSRVPFFHLSGSQAGNEVAFFESGHGKSLCDSFGGLIKRSATQHVVTRKGAIRSAKELYEFCKVHLTEGEELPKGKCMHKRRRFVYVETIERQKETTALKTIKGTQKLHSLKSVGEAGELITRKVSCFCKGCVNDESCENKEYVDNWQEASLFPQKRKRTASQDSVTKRPKKETKAKANKKESSKKQNSGKQQKQEKQRACNGPKKDKNNNKTNTNRRVKDHLKILKGIYTNVQNFADLEQRIKDIDLDDLPPVAKMSVTSINGTIDMASWDLRPIDIDPHLVPVKVRGDGNCLPRCGSLLAYGTQDKHSEMRLRMLKELVDNQQYYLTNEFQNFALYSMHFKQNMALTDIAIEHIFHMECFSTCKNSEYLGLWQLACLATVLGHPLTSVYPTYAAHNIRDAVHREFLPRPGQQRSSNKGYIMWTNTKGMTQPETTWTPNHFVILLPVEIEK